MDLQRPPVTVRDPSRPSAVRDQLGDEDDAVRARRWPAVVAVGALLAGAVGWGVVRDRAARDEQLRLDGVAALSLSDGRVEDVLGPAVSSRASLVSIDLRVRNDGPRPVRVDHAVIGDFRFLGQLDLAPGEVTIVPLLRTVTCPSDDSAPPLDPAAEGLRVRVLTLAGPRSVLVSPGELPLERLRTTSRRACGHATDVEEAVRVRAAASAGDDGTAVVSLRVTSSSVHPLLLLDVALAAGLRTVSEVWLPRALAPDRRLDREPVDTRLAMRVAPDCDAAPRDADGRLLPLATPPLTVVVGVSSPGSAAIAPTSDGLGPLRRAYAAACS